MTWAMWSTSSRVPWKALLLVSLLSSSTMAAHAAFAHGVLAFDHQGAGAHAEDRAVAAPVERQGRFVHAVVGGGGADGQEAGANPFHAGCRR